MSWLPARCRPRRLRRHFRPCRGETPKLQATHKPSRTPWESHLAPRGFVLIPEERYLGMRNVWNIPSCATVLDWLEATGYRNARIVDVTPTTPEEQHATPWSSPHSLVNFLNPHDPTKTIEGYPGPLRALMMAERLP